MMRSRELLSTGPEVMCASLYASRDIMRARWSPSHSGAHGPAWEADGD